MIHYERRISTPPRKITSDPGFFGGTDRCDESGFAVHSEPGLFSSGYHDTSGGDSSNYCEFHAGSNFDP